MHLSIGYFESVYNTFRHARKSSQNSQTAAGKAVRGRVSPPSGFDAQASFSGSQRTYFQTAQAITAPMRGAMMNTQTSPALPMSAIASTMAGPMDLGG